MSFCLCLSVRVILGYLGTLTAKIRANIAQKTDFRVRLMNQIVSGIQVIKMYAWEIPFERIVKGARHAEIADISTASVYRALYASGMLFLRPITLCITIVCYVILGHHVTPDKIFSVAQTMSVLQIILAVYLPTAISDLAETITTIRRLRDFLVLEEREFISIGALDDSSVVIEDVSASWTPSTQALENLTLNIPPGSLCAIVGPVASGKSSLLQVSIAKKYSLVYKFKRFLLMICYSLCSIPSKSVLAKCFTRN